MFLPASGSLAASFSKRLNEEYDLKQLYGRGVSSTVHVVYPKKFEEASEELLLAKIYDVECEDSADLEARCLQRLSENRFVVDMQDFGWLRGKKAIIMKDCGSTLFDKVHKKGNKYSPKKCANFARQFIEAFEDIEKKNIVHVDVKSSNLCLRKGVLKIIDFSISFFMEKDEEFIKKEFLKGTPEFAQRQMQTFTSRAPEVYSYDVDKYSSKMDVWSLGCILFEMLTGEYLFGQEAYVLMKSTGGRRHEQWEESTKADVLRCEKDSSFLEKRLESIAETPGEEEELLFCKQIIELCIQSVADRPTFAELWKIINCNELPEVGGGASSSKPPEQCDPEVETLFDEELSFLELLWPA